jgi:hypothetical protein
VVIRVVQCNGSSQGLANRIENTGEFQSRSFRHAAIVGTECVCVCVCVRHCGAESAGQVQCL